MVEMELTVKQCNNHEPIALQFEFISFCLEKCCVQSRLQCVIVVCCAARFFSAALNLFMFQNANLGKFLNYKVCIVQKLALCDFTVG